MDLLLSNFIVAIFLIFPGAIVISKLFKCSILNISSIIMGSIFWHTVLILPAIVIASFTTYVNYYFYIFWIISILVLVLQSITAIKNFSKISFHVSHTKLPILAFIITESIFIALSTLYHPIYNEFDAFTYYLPMAKGINMTGGLFYNPYYLSEIFVVRAPLMPSLYAATSLFGDSSFRLIPFVFYALTLLIVYTIAKEIFEGNTQIPIVSAAVFSSLPVVILVFSKYSLYLEPSLMFYSSASFLFAYMASKYNKAHWYVFAGLSAGLALMTKETGYIAFVIVLLMLSLRGNSKLKSVVMGIFPSVVFYFSFFIYDFTNGLPFLYVMYRQVSVVCLIAISGLLVLIYKHQHNEHSSASNLERSEGHGSYNFLLFLIVFTAVGLFTYLRNYLIYQTPSVLLFFPEKFPSFFPSPQFEYPVTIFFRWDVLFTSIALGGMLFLPKVVGMIRALNGENKRLLILLVWIVVLTADWAFFYKCSYMQNEVRRLLIFAPVFSIVAAYGLYEILRLLRGHLKYYTTYALIFCSTILWFVTSYQLSYWRYNGLRYSLSENWSLIDAGQLLLSIGIVAVLAILFGRSFLPDLRSSLSTAAAKISSKCFNKIPVFLLIIIVLSSLMPAYLIIQRSQDATLVNWSITSYGERALYPSWELNMPEVINYVKAQTDENDVILSFGIFTKYIAYFAERSVVDVSSGDGFLFALRNLNYSNPANLIGILAFHNIRYILLPNENNTAVYDGYLTYSRHMPILSLPLNSTGFASIKNFKYWNLYKILSSEDILYNFDPYNITCAYPPHVSAQKTAFGLVANFAVPDYQQHYYRIETKLPRLEIDPSKDVCILMKYKLIYEVQSGSPGVPLVEFYSEDNKIYLTSFKVQYSSNITTAQIFVPKEKLNIFDNPSTLRLMIFTENIGNYSWFVEDLTIASL